ncbi:MAG: sulfatase-like hydrolase/transferase [Acidimicrobiales bacterium]|nr:sulfatase-like hydrolase/transferase [Acidimicrobiales bacterium]
MRDDRRGRAIELVTMCALAVAQPVYAVLGANTAELVARQVDGVAWSSDLAAAAGCQAHLLNLEATDHLVGELLEHLRAVDMLDDTMLVVMADHGVAFVGGEPFRAATEATVDQVAYPPLFIKEPGQRDGAVSDLPAEVVDVVPTIADVAGIPLPWVVDGVSLRDVEAVQASPRAFHPLFRDRLEATSSSGTVELRDDFEARVARNAALLASGADEVALGSLPGASPGLVGRVVDDLAVAPQADGTASVGPSGQDLVVSDDAPIPAFVEVQLDRGGGRTLAVALDGRVVLAGATTPDGLLWGYLPIERLTPGTHRVDVYEVTQGATEPTLAPVASP